MRISAREKRAEDMARQLIELVGAAERDLERTHEAFATISVNARRVDAQETDAAKLRWLIGCIGEIAGVVAVGGTQQQAIQSYEARAGRWPPT